MATFAGLGANGTVTTAVNNSRNGVAVVVRAETEETAVPEGEPEEKVQASDSPQQKGVIVEEGNEAIMPSNIAVKGAHFMLLISTYPDKPGNMACKAESQGQSKQSVNMMFCPRKHNVA